MVMQLRYALLTLLYVLQCATVGAQLTTCTNVTRTKASTADYLFAVDGSGSMCPEIAAVASGLAAFADMVTKSKIQARYGIVQFGGVPKILLPFTNDSAMAQQVITNMGCTAGGQEAAFETLRGSLPPLNGRDFKRGCIGDTSTAYCNLNWNENATKIIILVTDEDSDLPTISSYRMPGQNESTSYCANHNYMANGTCTASIFEPAFYPAGVSWYSSGKEYNIMRTGTNLRLGDVYETEMALTAQLLIQNEIFLNAVVSTTVGGIDGLPGLPISAFNARSNPYFAANMNSAGLTADNLTTATYQFGHPNFQVQADNFSNFDSAATLARLTANNMGNSLQARMLQAGMYSRVFDIVNFDGTTQPAIVSAFYNSIVETTSYLDQMCSVVTTTSAVASTSTKKPTSSSSTLIKAISSSAVPASSRAATLVSTSSKQSTSTQIAATTPIALTSSEASSAIATSSAAPGATGSLVFGSTVTAVFTQSTTLSTSTSTSTSDQEDATLMAVTGGEKPTSSDNGGNSMSIVLPVAIVGSLLVIAAAMFAIYRSRVGNEFMQTHQGLAAALGLAKSNPLYKDQFGFHENPVYASNSTDVLSGSQSMNMGSRADLT